MLMFGFSGPFFSAPVTHQWIGRPRCSGTPPIESEDWFGKTEDEIHASWAWNRKHIDH